MLEFIGAVVLSWYFLLFLACGAVWSIHVDSEGWALLWLVALVAVAYFLFSITFMQLMYVVGAYIPIGLVWSVWRFRRYCKDELVKANVRINNATNASTRKLERSRYTDKVNPTNNISDILIWTFIWPFSFLENLLSDLIDLVEDFIRKYLIKIYETIAKKYIGQLEQEKPPVRVDAGHID